MFKKIIIAEDHEVENLGVINTLKELHIQDFEFINYCDDTLHKIQKAITLEKPYELLITDLGFDNDYKVQSITSGQQLIEKARKLQPNLKIIVFSIEKKPMIIDELFKRYNVNGFVSKGRNDGKELINTIKKVFMGETVIPQEILNSIRNNSLNLTDYDINLLNLIAKGWKQQEIVKHFKKQGISPESRSAIEKRLNELRETLNAKNNIEMIVICKDIGIL